MNSGTLLFVDGFAFVLALRFIETLTKVSQRSDKLAALVRSSISNSLNSEENNNHLNKSKQ